MQVEKLGSDKLPIAEAKAVSQDRRICCYAPEDPAVIRRVFILAIPFIWFLCEAIFDVRIGSIFRLAEVLGNNSSLVFVALIVSAAGFYTFYRYRLNHRLLTILDINDRGLSIGRLADKATSAVEYLVSWKEISTVEEKIKTNKAGHSGLAQH